MSNHTLTTETPVAALRAPSWAATHEREDARITFHGPQVEIPCGQELPAVLYALMDVHVDLGRVVREAPTIYLGLYDDGVFFSVEQAEELGAALVALTGEVRRDASETAAALSAEPAEVRS
ncbi:hypothetical protein [Cryocola sp. 340MFSha3.1]|uniref:hypothetical protein n=1 Tax=Cryocola sp. 340MFSha3.1 TaxID=1169145 RepID=UPI0003783D6B|nr:hypothetical protein [Cryocola sp. 340MFSha3.1]